MPPLNEYSQNEVESDWQSLFPSDVTTVKGSATFSQQLTALAFSLVLYLRNILPEKAFNERTLHGHFLKVLIGRSDSRMGNQIVACLRSAMLSMKEKHIKSLSLELRSEDEQLIELYTMEYNYLDDELHNKQEKNFKFKETRLENATQDLLCSIISSTEDLGPLPDSYSISFRTYFNETAPTDFSLPYFKCCEPTDGFVQVPGVKSSCLGFVTTDHHSMIFRGGSSLDKFEVNSVSHTQPVYVELQPKYSSVSFYTHHSKSNKGKP